MFNGKTWFIGTGEFSALCLENLVKKNFPLSKIITGLPTRSGRNSKLNVSKVEEFSNKLNLEVIRTGKLSENIDLISELQNQKPDLILVIDFGQIIKEPFLNSPKLGCLNIHPSMLPKWRGAAPIQRALLNGDNSIGVSVFRLVQEMDAGPILAQREIEINNSDSAKILYEKLSDLGTDLLIEGLNNFSLKEQDDKFSSYADKLEKEDFEISFGLTAQKFFNSVRALDASGGAFIKINGKRLKIWKTEVKELKGRFAGEILNTENNPIVACSDYSVELIEVQAEGKKITSGKDWLNGSRVKHF